MNYNVGGGPPPRDYNQMYDLNNYSAASANTTRQGSGDSGRQPETYMESLRRQQQQQQSYNTNPQPANNNNNPTASAYYSTGFSFQNPSTSVAQTPGGFSTNPQGALPQQTSYLYTAQTGSIAGTNPRTQQQPQYVNTNPYFQALPSYNQPAFDAASRVSDGYTDSSIVPLNQKYMYTDNRSLVSGTAAGVSNVSMSINKVAYRNDGAGCRSASCCSIFSTILSLLCSALMIISIATPGWRSFITLNQQQTISRHEGLWMYCFRSTEIVGTFQTTSCQSYIHNYKQVAHFDVTWLHWVRAFSTIGVISGFVGFLVSITRTCLRGFQTRGAAIAGTSFHIGALMFFGPLTIFIYAAKSVDDEMKQTISDLSFMYSFWIAVATSLLLFVVIVLDLYDVCSKIKL